MKITNDTDSTELKRNLKNGAIEYRIVTVNDAHHVCSHRRDRHMRVYTGTIRHTRVQTGIAGETHQNNINNNKKILRLRI